MLNLIKLNVVMRLKIVWGGAILLFIEKRENNLNNNIWFALVNQENSIFHIGSTRDIVEAFKKMFFDSPVFRIIAVKIFNEGE